MDYGKEVNDRIKQLREKRNAAYEEVRRCEDLLAEWEAEREDARKECGHCNDCSMCLP